MNVTPDADLQKRMEALTETYRKLCMEAGLETDVTREELEEPARRLMQRAMNRWWLRPPPPPASK